MEPGKTFQFDMKETEDKLYGVITGRIPNPAEELLKMIEIYRTCEDGELNCNECQLAANGVCNALMELCNTEIDKVKSYLIGSVGPEGE